MTFSGATRRRTWWWSGRLVLLAISGSFGLAGAVILSHGGWIKAKAVVAQVLLDRAWERTLAGETDVRPWPWADIRPELELKVLRLAERAVVIAGVSGEALAFGPGWMEDTAPPGTRGLAVLAGHRDTHFAFLEALRIGDEIVVTRADGARLPFIVTETRIVDAQRSGLYADSGAPRIALVTCWPFDAVTRGNLRFVVIADLAAGSGPPPPHD